MNLYAIGCSIQVMKTSFLSPFQSGPKEVTVASIIESLKKMAGCNEQSLILFPDLESAKIFANRISDQLNDTGASYYVNYPPIVEVSFVDEAAVSDVKPQNINIPGLLTINVVGQSTLLCNIEFIHSYFYNTGGCDQPKVNNITFDKPLTLDTEDNNQCRMM